MLNATLLKRFAPNARADIAQGLVDGWPAIYAAGISTPLRLQHFMAQTFHESAGYATTIEYWGPTAAQKGYEGRADLGNTRAGDGSLFRGRGIIQTTGRASYRQATTEIRKLRSDAPDFEAHPEALALFPWALMSALAFWTTRGLNTLADRDDVEAVTRRINGGVNGLAERKAALAKAKGIFTIIAPPSAGAPSASAPQASPAPFAVLSLGSPYTDAVRALQSDLGTLGYMLAVDGDFGPGTEKVVKLFQTAHSLVADGKVGAITRQAITDAILAKAADPPAAPAAQPTASTQPASAGFFTRVGQAISAIANRQG